ncbi:MAG: UPF0236 family protein [Clostridia bacterium]|nr:UPF0236 family protein [Clostridia bacterium]
MIITLQMEIGKENLNNFDGFLSELKEKLLEAGREIVSEALESRDNDIFQARDKKRFRSKGKRKTCVKTWFGAVEYKREVYADLADPDHKHYVYLLDEEIKTREVGCVSKDICKIAAQAVINSSYRGAATEISEMTGLSISPQGVWNIIQQIGQNNREKIENYSEKSKKHELNGVIDSKIVYEENDGIWLKLQGKSRKEYGTSREMKVGIAYDGATWKIGKGKKKRRTLDNKIAYAAFESAGKFRKNKEGLLASRFNVDEIELRVINGDGAQWIQKRPGVKCICVLDKFHRNKKITECVRDEQAVKTIRSLIYKGKIQDVMDYIEALINSVEDPRELSGLRELQMYYQNNFDALTDPYSRGIEIPETIQPGTVHHARLGSMESNVFTLIGNRMKGRRAAWSIKGANNLSAILCAYHTSGMQSLFEPNCNLYQPEEPLDFNGLSAAKIPQRVGHGYEPEHQASSDINPWLRKLNILRRF